MPITFRPYAGPTDYTRVLDFLLAHYQPGNRDGNWLAPVWEYMHGHPYLDAEALGRIGLWEAGGALTAIAHYESQLGEAFFQFHPDQHSLRTEVLDHAERHLAAPAPADNTRTLRAYINADEAAFTALAAARGYRREPQSDRPLYQFAIPEPFPAIHLPAGFRLQSLADECDWAKVHRVMWRGFNHAGEPPAGDDELESRRRMFDTPTARRDLKIVVVAPSGEFVAFCGMFYVPAHRYAYVEPVATDPAYRRLGLGRAAVLEGIRRCGALGATVAYVGSDQAFYQALGFTHASTSACWVKTWADGGAGQ